MQAEINESMAVSPVDSTLDVTTADLEAELSDLLAGESDQQSTAFGVRDSASSPANQQYISSPQAHTRVSPGFGDSGLSARSTVSPFGLHQNVPSRGLRQEYGSVLPEQYSYPPRDTFHTSPGGVSGATGGDDGLLNSDESDLASQIEALKVLEGMCVERRCVQTESSDTSKTQRELQQKQVWSTKIAFSGWKQKTKPHTEPNWNF